MRVVRAPLFAPPLHTCLVGSLGFMNEVQHIQPEVIPAMRIDEGMVVKAIRGLVVTFKAHVRPGEVAIRTDTVALVVTYITPVEGWPIRGMASPTYFKFLRAGEAGRRVRAQAWG